MLALKTLLTVAGLLLLTTAFGLPLYALWLRIQNARRIAKGEESVVQPEEISWRGPLGLAMVACLPLLVARSIVVVPSGMGGVRISQIEGTVPGTLYPGVHFITPLVDTVQIFDLRDHIFTAGMGTEGTKGMAPKTALNVQSREGLNIGLGVTVRYKLDPNKLASAQVHLPQPADKEIVPPVVASAWRELAPQYTVREIFSTKREEERANPGPSLAHQINSLSLFCGVCIVLSASLNDGRGVGSVSLYDLHIGVAAKARRVWHPDHPALGFRPRAEGARFEVKVQTFE